MASLASTKHPLSDMRRAFETLSETVQRAENRAHQQGIARSFGNSSPSRDRHQEKHVQDMQACETSPQSRVAGYFHSFCALSLSLDSAQLLPQWTETSPSLAAPGKAPARQRSFRSEQE